MWLCDALNRLIFDTRSRLRCRPFLYRLNRELRAGSIYADGDTDIVIEGAPRSANSFVVAAFEDAHDGDIEVADHLHAAAHVVRGCELRVPVLVLIREPLDYLVSRAAFCFHVSIEEDECHPQIAVPHRMFLRDWIRFYSTAWPHRDRFVVATFDRVTEDLSVAVQRVNDRFGTDFRPFSGGPKEVRRLQDQQGYHAGPSPLRDGVKAIVRARLEEKVARDGTGIRRELKRAQRLYEEYDKYGG